MSNPVTPPPSESGAAGAKMDNDTKGLIVVGVLIVAVIALLARPGGDDDSAAENTAAQTSTTVQEPTESAVTEPDAPVDTAVADTEAPPATEAPAPTDAPTTTVAPESTTTTTPSSTLAPETDPAEPGAPVEESKAVVRGGQIYLTGAVPTVEAGEEIEALAAEILGPDNVFNDYFVDPAAGDPNLGNITVEDTITFPADSAVIDQSSEGLLNQGLVLMNIRPAMTITVIGHTDSVGSDDYNLRLSQARADSVVRWFVDRGIDPGRLTAIGRGETEPIADNETSDGRRLNRRIQFFLENILG
jgi:OOP family OmpA-OmpF porin